MGQLEYIGLDDNIYSVFLYFDEPVLIQEDLEGDVSVSFNTEVSGTVDKVTLNDTRNHNAY